MAEQRVNSLLWERDSAARAFISLLRDLASVTRVLPQTASAGTRDALGQPALEFLISNMYKLRRRKLQLIPQHTMIDLVLPSAQRGTRGGGVRGSFRMMVDESVEDETERVIQHALKDVANMAELIALNYEGRRSRQHSDRLDVFTAMAGCLDLLQMSRPSSVQYRLAARNHLSVLTRWARRHVDRVRVASGEEIERVHHDITLPPDEVLIGEFDAIAQS
mmetsp:Transcript_23850/g.61440  ORF Transcript_23850/g.61440 Transcript_23850/m.61440 type:complete len:220 (-) Transcript_23850:653-1312(-)